MKTYITLASYGSYDLHNSEIIYAGESEVLAYDSAKKFVFPDDVQNFLSLEVWEDGKKIAIRDIDGEQK